ncbi:MAG: hypothetical protein WBI63_01355 [Coriobacteriia bacterium]
MVLPPLTTLIALGIVIASSIALLAVGAKYEWNVTAEGHVKWTRVIGVLTVLGLTATTAAGRIGEPFVAVAICVGGIALGIAFIWAHVTLTRRAVDALASVEKTD